MKYYSRHLKTGILLFAVMWIDLENIMFSEIYQRKKYLYDITYMQNLKSE